MENNNNKSVISIVIGVISLISIFFLKAWMVFTLGIIGLVVALSDKNKSVSKIIGIVINIISIVISLVLLVCAFLLMNRIYDDAKEVAFASEVNSIIKTAQHDFFTSVYSVNKKSRFCDSSQKLDGCNELTRVSLLKPNYYLQLDDSGEVSQIAVANGYFCYIALDNPDINNIKNDITSTNSNILSCMEKNGVVSCSCK